MSQVVRKFKDSGKIEQTKPDLFERTGVGKYDKTKLVSGLYRNIDTYIQNNNLSGDRANTFRDAANQFIKGVENGTITMEGDGTFSDLTGQMTSTGKYDKNWIGKKKDTSNNAFNMVGDYALDYIKQMSTEPIEKRSRFNPEEYLENEISKQWYGGSKRDTSNWFGKRTEQERLGLLGNIFNSADYQELYNKYDWAGSGIDSADMLSTKFKRLGTALSSNSLDNEDYNAFANLGGSGLDKWLREDKAPSPVDQESPTVSLKESLRSEAKASGLIDEASINAFIEKGLRDQLDKERSIIDTNEAEKKKRATEEYFRRYEQENPFKSTLSGAYVGVKPNYREQDLDNYIVSSGNDYFSNVLSRQAFTPEKGQHIVNNFDYLSKFDPESLVDVGGGFKAVPTTYDYNKYSAIAFNPTTNQYKEVSMLANQVLKNLAFAYYNNPQSNTPRKETPIKKGGGAGTKFQEGGTISYERGRTKILEKRATKGKASEQNTAQQAESSGRTPEQVKAGSRKPAETGFTGTDYTRLASIVADIGSIASAYIPVYGTAASATLGYGSSLANFGADWAEDGLQWGDVGNLAMNLGLDTVGLVPGLGSGAKGSKILKTAGKYIPRALTALAAWNYTGPAIESMNKAVKGEKLTVDDWRNIGEGLKLVLQGGKGLKRTVQGKMLQNKIKTGNKVLTTRGGKEVSLTPSQLDEVKSHKELVDQQAALQRVKGDNNLGLVSDLNKRWYNPTKYTPNSNLRDELDFKATKAVNVKGKTIQVPVIYSGSEKALSGSMQLKTPNLLGVENLVRGYNNWKYRHLPEMKGGGTLHLQSGGNVRIKSKDMSGWDRSGALSKYNWLDDFDNFSKTYTGDDDARNAYMTSFNGGEDIYDELSNKTGNYFGNNYKYSIQDPLAKQRQVTFRGTNQGFDDLIRKGIIGYGTTEGANQFDVYAGDRTGNRTLGRGLSTDDVTRFNTQLRQKGMELYDKGDGGYRLREFLGTELPGVTVTANKVNQSSKTPVVGSNPNSKRNFNLNVLPEDILALGRMAGGLATNNKAAKLYKEGLKPTLIDTFENTVPLQGSYQSKALAQQQASALESTAAKPRTSDASLQLAGELDASDRANQAKFQGGLQDAEMFYKTRMLGQQESDAAKARRVEVANRNRASMNQIDAAKKQIDAARVTANYQQVLAPYLAGVENQFRQNRAMGKQLQMEQMQNNMATEYDNLHSQLVEQYKDNPTLLNSKLKELRNKATTDMLNQKGRILGNPFLFNIGQPSSNKIPYSKKGSKLSYEKKAMLQSSKDFNKRLLEDNKLSHKNIEAAKKDYSKMVMSMSSLTAQLIKNGMSL